MPAPFPTSSPSCRAAQIAAGNCTAGYKVRGSAKCTGVESTVRLPRDDVIDRRIVGDRASSEIIEAVVEQEFRTRQSRCESEAAANEQGDKTRFVHVRYGVFGV